jgi:endogenous inhibitor of DNA gyrase (YacG/DUF329 family)
MKRKKINCPECGKKIKESRKEPEWFYCKKCKMICTEEFVHKEAQLKEYLKNKMFESELKLFLGEDYSTFKAGK